MADVVKLEYRGNERGYIAIITFDNPKKLNALNLDHYFQLAKYMREIALRDDVYVTVLVRCQSWPLSLPVILIRVADRQREILLSVSLDPLLSSA